jgi:ornithine cyclodeaminase
MVLMPGYLAGPPPTLGLKFLGVFDGNARVGKDPHQGVVLLLDPDTGEPVAVLNAAAITSVRTAAVSALATDVLARADASVLTIFGAGVQARWHAAAIATVRPLSEVRVVARDPARTRAFANLLTTELGLVVSPVADPRTALAGADIVVTATTAVSPVFSGSWLGRGVHINAVGACVADHRELDAPTVVAARFITDRRESALAEAGDFVLAAAECGLPASHIAAELGEVLLGQVPGRETEDQLTIFKSLGLAAEDLAAAAFIQQVGAATGRGTAVEF